MEQEGPGGLSSSMPAGGLSPATTTSPVINKRALLSSSSSKQSSNRANYADEASHQQRINEKIQQSLDELGVTIVSDEDDDEDDDDEDDDDEDDDDEDDEDDDGNEEEENDKEELDVLGELKPAQSPVNGVSHLNMMLERKPTLEVDFMRNLTLPDPVQDKDNLFETSQRLGSNGGEPGSPITEGGSTLRLRRTGFESWLANPNLLPPALHNNTIRQEVCLLACRHLSVNKSSSSAASLLKSVSLALFAGKTTLLLAPPGASTGLLLQCLAGKHREICTVDQTSSTQQCVQVMCHSQDELLLHGACTLTVRETLEFYAQLELGAPSREFVLHVVESLGLLEQSNLAVQALNLSQLRRLALGTKLFSPTKRVLLLDEITNGLGANESQQIMRIVRSACKVLGFTCLVSLQQPSDMLVDSFDQMLVLTTEGELAFAGRTAECVEYFEHHHVAALGRGEDFVRPGGMSTYEFIMLCILQAKARPGKTFTESRDGLEYVNRVDAALTKVEDPLSFNLPPNSNWRVFCVLARRDLVLISRNPISLKRLVCAVAFSISIASLFGELGSWNLFCNSYLFVIVFFLYAWNALITLESNFANKLVVGGSSSRLVVLGYASQVATGLPLTVVEALVYSVISYWWVGLNPNHASVGFCYYLFVLMAVGVNGQALGRLVAFLCPTSSAAQLLAVPYMLLGALVSGFAPNYGTIPGWWQWLNWLNPMSYAMEGLSVNEFLSFRDRPSLSPLAADLAGTPRFPLEGYGSLNSPAKVMGFDFGMLLVFALLVDLAGVVAALGFYHVASRQPIANPHNRLTVANVDTLLQTIARYFFALKRQAERDDGSEEDEEDHSSFAPNATEAPLTLSLVDLTLFIKPQSVVPMSFDYYYTMALFGLRNCLRKGEPVRLNKPEVNSQTENTDALPMEERIQMKVHRPRGGAEGGAIRERAWSNKLPTDEEEREYNHGALVGETLVVDKVGAAFRSGEMSLLLLSGNGSCSNGAAELLQYMGKTCTTATTRASGKMYVNNSTHPEDWHRAFVGKHQCFAGRLRVGEVIESKEILALLQLDGEEMCCNLPLFAQKLVSIGMHLQSPPPQLLFCEEPTFGMDSAGSELVAIALRRLTRKLKLITVVSLNRPTRSVFGQFDCVSLLESGQVAYHGAISSFHPFASAEEDEKDGNGGGAQNWRNVSVIHRQPSGFPNHHNKQQDVGALLMAAPTIGDTVLAYFASLGAPPLRQGFNPADHVLIAIDALLDNGVNVTDIFAESREIRDMHQEIAKAVTRQFVPVPEKPSTAIATTLWRAIRCNLLVQWRDSVLFAYRVWWTVLCAIFIGTVFFHMPCTLAGAWLRIAALFFVVLALALFPLLIGFPYYYHTSFEGNRGEGNWKINALAATVSELPLHAVLAVLFYAIVYYALGLDRSSEETGYFVLAMFLGNWMLHSFVRAVVLLMPNRELAQGLAALVVLLSTLLMGFLVPISLMPGGWRWATWLNMFYYLLRGLSVSELSGQYFSLDLVGGGGEECSPTFPRFQLVQQQQLVECTAQAYEQLMREFNLVSTCSQVCSTLSCAEQTCGGEIGVFAQDLVRLGACWNVNLDPFLSRLEQYTKASMDLTTALTPNLVRGAEAQLNVLAAAGKFWSEDDVLPWFLHTLVTGVNVVRGETVLAAFGWWSSSSTVDDNTAWWFCTFAVGMFIVGWELLGVGGSLCKSRRV
ncbi:hypothetical protein BASA81_001638 [Batrachochytrium salamandrivorans]|nr:hypothetical protein BASA81_001638 [Batrachochytrium salamandrivorans]